MAKSPPLNPPQGTKSPPLNPPKGTTSPPLNPPQGTKSPPLNPPKGTTSTLCNLFLEFFDRPRSDCLLHRLDGSYRPISTEELAGDVGRLLAAFGSELGISPGDRVALVAENGPDWLRVDLAALAAGAVVVPLHPALPADELAARIEASAARAVFADGRLAELRARRDAMPAVEHVVGIGTSSGVEGSTNLAALLGKGAVADAGAFVDQARRRRDADPATLVTSAGTTGEPKELLLTHGQLAAAISAAAELLPIGERHTAFVSRPLASPLERILHYLYLHRGATVAYPESPATVDRDLAEVRPHVASLAFTDVKRLMNRVYDGVRTSPPWRRRLFRWAVGVGRSALPQRLRGERPPGLLGLKLSLADKWVFEKLRRSTGGRLEIVVSTGTPLSQGWITFLWAAGLPVFEAYGLADAAAIVSLNAPGRVKLETAGRPVPGVEVRIADDGEVLLRGPGVISERDEDSDRAEDGWFATGDVGCLDEEGYLTVTGRKAERTRVDGEVLSPMLIERLLGGSHFIRHAVISPCAGQPPVALLVPDFERLETVVKHHGIEAKSREEWVRHPRIRQIFERELKSFETILAEHERPRAWELLPAELSLEDGELTAAGTVRRHAVLERYADVVERLVDPATS